MKKVLCLAAIAALCVGTTAFADTTLQIRVVDGSDNAIVTAAPGDEVAVEIQGQLVYGAGDDSMGLALWSVNLGNAGDEVVDLCDSSGFLVWAPTGDMEHFDRLFGLTNPAGLPLAPDRTGYSGTCDGASGLWQVGGGQNTIANEGGQPAYPTGSVVLDVADGGWQTLAEGYIVVPTTPAGSQIVLQASSVFGNTIEDGAATPPPPGSLTPYEVAAIENTSVADLTINIETVPAVNIVSVASNNTAAIAINYPSSVDAGTVTSETRTSGITQVAITFDGVPGACTGAGCLTVEYQTGATGDEASWLAYPAAAVTFNSIVGNTLTLDLTGVAECATYKFTIGSEVSSVADSFRIRSLLGDLNSDGTTSALDKGPLYGTIAAGTFVANYDINDDGVVSALDKGPLYGKIAAGQTGGCYQAP